MDKTVNSDYITVSLSNLEYQMGDQIDKMSIKMKFPEYPSGFNHWFETKLQIFEILDFELIFTMIDQEYQGSLKLHKFLRKIFA